MQTLVLLFAVISAEVEFPAGVYPTVQSFKPPAPAFRATTEHFPRVVYFGQKSCPPCVPRWNDLVGYATPSGWTSGTGANVNLQYCDVDENPELADRAGVNQTPSIAMMQRDGIGQAIPYGGRADFVQLLKPAFKATISDAIRAGCKLRPDLGSGINTEYGVITCWHCVSSGKPIEVECDGEVGRGTVIAKDEAADVALVSVAWKSLHPTVSLTPGTPSGSLSLVARGDDGLIMIKPSIEVTGQDFDGKMIVSKPSVSKQSGGGYIDSNGNLAGIVSGNIAIEPFKGLMIPADTIRRILPERARKSASVPAEAAPTPYAEVVRVLDLLPKPTKGFVDFGCGADARWCIAAAEKWGVHCVGVEIDPTRAKLAQERVNQEGLADLIDIYCCDSTQYSFPSCDVGVAYLYPRTLEQLKPKIEGLIAFASMFHQPPVPSTQNGNAWIYRRNMVYASSVQQPVAIWEGQQYTGPVCDSWNCPMCNSIRAQLSRGGQR